MALEKHVVLLGAGNANLVMLRSWAMNRPAARLTLVNPSPKVPYSAMVPGYIAGTVSRQAMEIDLVKLTQHANARLILSSATAISASQKTITFGDRPCLTYDLLSLCTGSEEHAKSPSDKTLKLKPLGLFLDQIETLVADRTSFHIVIVGGGASGIEIALSLKTRFSEVTGFQVCLIQKGSLPFTRSAAKWMRQTLQKRDIDLIENSQATTCDALTVTLKTSNGVRQLPYDRILWATLPKSSAIQSDLKRDTAGFFLVDEYLRCLGQEDVYASGDCASLVSHDLAKSGVYSVRQGQYLCEQLFRKLEFQSVKGFRPQHRFLTILDTSDGKAILQYGNLAFRGRWCLKVKRVIDKRWVAGFQNRASMTMNERCGGCGSKIGETTLKDALSLLRTLPHPREIIGLSHREDVAVCSVDPTKLQVMTCDFFRTFIGDDYLFGKIAALHALSDIYAKSAVPVSALCTAVVPHDRSPTVLHEVLAGVNDVLRVEKTSLVGGHSCEGARVAIGLTVIGEIEPRRLRKKNGLRKGDTLVLTKGLGTGALMAAHGTGQCDGHFYQLAIASMLQSNREASEIANRHATTACTDITGFGLAGHLLEMLEGLDLTAILETDHIPLIPGTREVMSMGIRSTLHGENRKNIRHISGSVPEWLFDPQTSGGLLFAVAEVPTSFVTELTEAGYKNTAVIGQVHGYQGTKIKMIP